MQRARDVVRTVNSGMTGDIRVYLRGGTYPVASTIAFTPADSGTNGHRVVYSAQPGETPVLDAGVRVTGWSQHSGNIWKAPLSRSTKLRALYVNDKRAAMAAKTVTSLGCSGTYTVTAGQAPWAWESGSECDGARYTLSDRPYGGATNQNWKIAAVGGGAIEIANQRSGKLLAVLDSSTQDGAAVVQWADGDRAEQRWQLVDAGGGYTVLRNVHSGKVLAVSGSSTAAGGRLVQTADTGATSQRWQIIRVG
ncbi:RICIN domain-containing protein [Nocardia sp. NRRL S-836]|uniref:RICIN domain-containing protein n=1 Tax=Nocardia sp. NRRL S-836 TaxID=1519492 RepID=UPI0006AE568F|nr:RICIN domain-containing protein [Nocardia sp. NRRL S-836]KOV87946.1 hypothetical protein ADL03_06230 [Nocardia sp. NRRL S-836]